MYESALREVTCRREGDVQFPNFLPSIPFNFPCDNVICPSWACGEDISTQSAATELKNALHATSCFALRSQSVESPKIEETIYHHSSPLGTILSLEKDFVALSASALCLLLDRLHFQMHDTANNRSERVSRCSEGVKTYAIS